jgi:hypothetical protein
MTPSITPVYYDSKSCYSSNIERALARISGNTSIFGKFELDGDKFVITTIFRPYGMPEVQSTTELVSTMQPHESIQVQCAKSADAFDPQEEPTMVTILISIRGPTTTLLYNVRWISDNVATDAEFTHAF